jgi:hypothetical protein
MVQVSTMLAALGCVLTYSGSPLVSGSPVDLAPAALPHHLTLSPITWRGTLEEGQLPVDLTGDSIGDIEKQAKALNPDYTIFGGLEQNSTRLSARQTVCQCPN